VEWRVKLLIQHGSLVGETVSNYRFNTSTINKLVQTPVLENRHIIYMSRMVPWLDEGRTQDFLIQPDHLELREQSSWFKGADHTAHRSRRRKTASAGEIWTPLCRPRIVDILIHRWASPSPRIWIRLFRKLLSFYLYTC